MIEWPSTIPLPLLEARGSPNHAILASEFSSARLQRRLRFRGDAVISLGVEWMLGIDQYDAFKEFFLSTLDLGARMFEIELLHPKTTALTEWVVRFSGPYEASYDSGIWKVSGSLYLIRPTALDDAAGLVGYEGFLVAPEDSSGDSEQFVTSDGFDFYVPET